MFVQAGLSIVGGFTAGSGVEVGSVGAGTGSAVGTEILPAIGVVAPTVGATGAGGIDGASSMGVAAVSSGVGAAEPLTGALIGELSVAPEDGVGLALPLLGIFVGFTTESVGVETELGEPRELESVGVEVLGSSGM